jgi:hypothetical protein
MEEQKLRQLFKNRSNCYVDTDDVVQGMDEDCFIETVNEAQNQPSCLGAVSGSLLSFEAIMNEAKRVKENVKAFPFHDVSFQYGAEWSRDTLIDEIKRRQELIISEPDGVVRETMIDNLLVGLQ